MPPTLSTAVERALASGSLEEVLRATLQQYGCVAGTIHLLEDGVLKLHASVNIPPPVIALVQTVPVGKGIAGLAAERREPITICNLQTDTSGQARPAARMTGLEGSLAVPMLDARGALRGVLGIAKADAYDWPADETGAVQALAQRIAEVRA